MEQGRCEFNGFTEVANPSVKIALQEKLLGRKICAGKAMEFWYVSQLGAGKAISSSALLIQMKRRHSLHASGIFSKWTGKAFPSLLPASCATVSQGTRLYVFSDDQSQLFCYWFLCGGAHQLCHQATLVFSLDCTWEGCVVRWENAEGKDAAVRTRVNSAARYVVSVAVMHAMDGASAGMHWSEIENWIAIIVFEQF